MNPRRHPKLQRNALAAVLSDLGWLNGVLVNETTGHLIDGHARVEEALARGETTVPVTYLRLSRDEELRALATYDAVGALATTDTAALDALLQEISTEDPAIGQLLETVARDAGLSLARAGLSDPDALPPLPEEAALYVRMGDQFCCGEHVVRCGDATNPDDVERLLAGAAPRLLATDPPYGVALDPTWRDALYNGLGPAARPYMRVPTGAGSDEGTAGAAPVRRRSPGHRHTSISGDTRVDWSEAFALVPSLEVGYVWHAGVHAGEVAAGLQRIGFEIVAQIIWDKGLFAMGRSWYHWSHEPCWAVRKRGTAVPFYGSRDQATIWRAPSPKMIMAGSREEKEDHPAQKPVVLYETPIANHLRPGEALYDPFLGSGTALVAAERLGRRCYGMEIDPRYVQIAIERWQRFTGRPAERVDGSSEGDGHARP